MKDEKLPEEQKSNNGEPQPQNTTRNYFYIALIACALGVVAFGLSFTVLGIYALISSILLEITALAFANTQQRKNNFKTVFYLKAVIYALLIALLVFFIGGIIYGSTQKSV